MLQALQLITKGYTIIIKANHHAQRALQIILKGINNFIRLVLAFTLLSHEHLIMLRNILGFGNVFQDQISSSTIAGIQAITRNMKHLAFLISFTGIAISYIKSLHLIFLPLCLPFYLSIGRRERFPQILRNNCTLHGKQPCNHQ